MGTNTVKKDDLPEGFIIDESLPSGFTLDLQEDFPEVESEPLSTPVTWPVVPGAKDVGTISATPQNPFLGKLARAKGFVDEKVLAPLAKTLGRVPLGFTGAASEYTSGQKEGLLGMLVPRFNNKTLEEASYGMPLTTGTGMTFGIKPETAMAPFEAAQVVPLGRLAAKGAGMAARAAMPTEAAVRIAQRANAMGIPLRPDMLYHSKAANVLGEALENVPLSGSRKAERLSAFNRNLVEQVGGRGPRLSPEVHSEALRRSGQTIGNIADRTPFPVDRNFQNRLAPVIRDVSHATPENRAIFESYIGALTDQLGPNNIIPGRSVREITTRLGAQIRSTTDPDLRRHLQGLQGALLGNLRRGIPNRQTRAAFDTARQQYAKSMTLEPLVAKATATDNIIDPPSLMGEALKGQGERMLATGRAGAMGDLAATGQRFFPAASTSSPMKKLAAYGAAPAAAVAGATTLGLPMTAGIAGGIYGLANVYNRAGPALTRAIAGSRPGGLSLSRGARALAGTRAVTPGGLALAAPSAVERFLSPEEYGK